MPRSNLDSAEALYEFDLPRKLIDAKDELTTQDVELYEPSER